MGINTPWMSIDRLDNSESVGYVPGNVVSCCFLCNKLKGSFFTEEEMLQIGKLFVAPKMKVFEQEAFEAFGEWCDYNVSIDDDEYYDTIPEIDLG